MKMPLFEPARAFGPLDSFGGRTTMSYELGPQRIAARGGLQMCE